MIPLSGWVLAVSAVLTSPALWASLVEQTMSLEVALTRYLVATAACWVALSVATDVVWPTSTPAAPESPTRDQDATADGGVGDGH
jgi:hypothetical protein